MKSYNLVARTIRGENDGRTPVYGWVSANLEKEILEAFGSVANFEDKYEFDLAHIFGGPSPYDEGEIDALRRSGIEVTPEVLLDIPLKPVDFMDDYKSVEDSLNHHRKQRDRFCYIQTPGIFECLNGPFGIENHLCYMAMYPEELKRVYRRQAEWNCRFASNMMELGVDMVHVSDDWGAQRGLLFSTSMWRDMIFPNHKIVCDMVKSKGFFVSMHSDGCILPVLDGFVELGYDLLHPWQEAAGMQYDVYLQAYTNKFAIMGGQCIQTSLGFGNPKKLLDDIQRVFQLLKGNRWVFCTTHFVQEHCSIDELIFAYDNVVRLARDF